MTLVLYTLGYFGSAIIVVSAALFLEEFGERWAERRLIRKQEREELPVVPPARVVGRG